MGYGPEGGIIDSMTKSEEIDHVIMLTEKLTHDEPDRRRKAAEAMAAYIADQRYLPAVLDPHPASILASVICQPRPNKLECLGAARALAIMGEHAAPYASEALGKMIHHKDHEERWEAIRALENLGPGAANGAAAALAHAVKEDDEAMIRYSAAKALSVLGPGAAKDAAAKLAEAVTDEDSDVQLMSAIALGALGPAAAPAAAPALTKAVETGSFEVRRFAVDSLRQMGEAAAEIAAPTLGKILRPDPGTDPQLRQKAASALAAMGDAAIYAQEVPLARALGDPDTSVREAARAALESAHHEWALKGPMGLFRPIAVDKSAEGAIADGGTEEANLPDEAAIAVVDAALENPVPLGEGAPASPRAPAVSAPCIPDDLWPGMTVRNTSRKGMAKHEQGTL